MSQSWDDRHESQAIELIEFLISIGAHKGDGADYRREDIAEELEWPIFRVDRTKRWIRQHPELGVGIMMKKGKGGVILSDPEHLLSGQTWRVAAGDGEAWHLGNMRQVVNLIQSDLANCKNLAEKFSTDTQQGLAADRRQRLKGILYGLRSGLNPHMPVEQSMIELIDRVIAAY